jgi:hypothetical protein
MLDASNELESIFHAQHGIVFKLHENTETNWKLLKYNKLLKTINQMGIQRKKMFNKLRFSRGDWWKKNHECAIAFKVIYYQLQTIIGTANMILYIKAAGRRNRSYEL